ncbi:MAG TPA: family 1 glycosylhydrolase [Thermoanaerobaculia bacterium]
MTPESRFPLADRPRLWGTAVSHYQVEGDDPCDWTEWERAGRTRGGACGRAVGGWARYEEDADLARDAGANAFRFSISWSRVEPRLGHYDDAALDRYSRFIDHLIKIDVEPVVTLFHYTHPQWFHERTPWTSTESIARFAEFAARVADRIGDRVRVWIPLNEPLVFLLAGYFDGQIPPGISDGRLLPKVFDHLLAAHCAAAAAIRERSPDAAIGVAHNMVAFAPERHGSFLDRMLAKIAHRCYNRGVLEAFGSGKWDFLLPPTTHVRGSREDLTKSLDFFGVNFYSRLHLRCPGKERFIGEFRYLDAARRGLTDNGWEIVPDAFEQILHEASAIHLPLIVSENGLADASDRMRARFLQEHALMLARTPVHGYLHWSLLDNYEWLDGFGPKFGLYEVDRVSMSRRPRPSVDTFRALGRQFLSRPLRQRSAAEAPRSL